VAQGLSETSFVRRAHASAIWSLSVNSKEEKLGGNQHEKRLEEDFFI
jgi:hypothetical protein